MEYSFSIWLRKLNRITNMQVLNYHRWFLEFAIDSVDLIDIVYFHWIECDPITITLNGEALFSAYLN